ncbi:nudix hydrolase [Anaeramoeba ignava]|uniref:Nudix hydrolase n=1 Tax=Anaeramoeba ignava TaxID=1746090 RepID=A0A9Q0LF49_ANAIG|nr:nudix hydrolase [Anaeramoeba ignava]
MISKTESYFQNKKLIHLAQKPEQFYLLLKKVFKMEKYEKLEKAKKEEKKIASVVLMNFEKANKIHLLILKRTGKVRHPNQFCFPGGSYKKSDENLKNTVLRELYEETGLYNNFELIGNFTPSLSTSNFLVLPFVGYLHSNDKNKEENANKYHIFDKNEIEYASEISLEVLLKTESKSRQVFGTEKLWSGTTFGIKYDDLHLRKNIIWGLSANFLDSYFSILRSHL